MLSEVSIERLPSYQIGMERGESALLRRQLTKRFGTLSERVEAQLAQADLRDTWACPGSAAAD